MKTENSIQKTFSKITIDSVGPSLNGKKFQAQVRQTVTSVYPGARGKNSLSDALYPDKSFGEGQAYEEIRVTWIPVPVGATVKQVEKELAKHPNARLQRTLSLKPILSEEQARAMATGLNQKTMEEYQDACIIDAEGEPVLYKGFRQYRSISFRVTAVEDVDTRDQDALELVPINMVDKSNVNKEKF